MSFEESQENEHELVTFDKGIQEERSENRSFKSFEINSFNNENHNNLKRNYDFEKEWLELNNTNKLFISKGNTMLKKMENFTSIKTMKTNKSKSTACESVKQQFKYKTLLTKEIEDSEFDFFVEQKINQLRHLFNNRDNLRKNERRNERDYIKTISFTESEDIGNTMRSLNIISDANKCVGNKDKKSFLNEDLIINDNERLIEFYHRDIFDLERKENNLKGKIEELREHLIHTQRKRKSKYNERNEIIENERLGSESYRPSRNLVRNDNLVFSNTCILENALFNTSKSNNKESNFNTLGFKSMDRIMPYKSNYYPEV
jgi:hypothetical protein